MKKSVLVMAGLVLASSTCVVMAIKPARDVVYDWAYDNNISAENRELILAANRQPTPDLYVSSSLPSIWQDYGRHSGEAAGCGHKYCGPDDSIGWGQSRHPDPGLFTQATPGIPFADLFDPTGRYGNRIDDPQAGIPDEPVPHGPWVPLIGHPGGGGGHEHPEDPIVVPTPDELHPPIIPTTPVPDGSNPPVAVPEPTTLPLLLAGMVALMLTRRGRRHGTGTAQS